MKQIALFIALCIGHSSCNKHESTQAVTSAVVSVIDDDTDPFELRPEPRSAFSLFGFENNADMSAIFRYQAISNMLLNPVVQYYLPNGETTERYNKKGVEHYRDYVTQAFYDSVASVLSLKKDDNPLDYSECYRTIAGEIWHVTGLEADRRILVIYGDLLEKSSIFNCYTSCGLYSLLYKSEQIARVFLAACPLPDDLSGLEVYFVFNAGNSRNLEQKYLAMAKVYSTLLKDRHATVTIQSSNNFYRYE